MKLLWAAGAGFTLWPILEGHASFAIPFVFAVFMAFDEIVNEGEQ